MTRGIDLNDPSNINLIRRLFFKRFARGLTYEGIEPDDALQEAFKKLIMANAGSNPYDPNDAKGMTPEGYIFMVIRSAVSHLRMKSKNKSKFNGDTFDEMDASALASSPAFEARGLHLRDRARVLGLPDAFLARIAQGDEPSVAADVAADGDSLEAMMVTSRWEAIRERHKARLAEAEAGTTCSD